MLEKLKWTATACLIVGSFINAYGFYYGPHILILGGLLWLAASAYMRDRPLIVTNSLMVLGGIAGLLFR